MTPTDPAEELAAALHDHHERIEQMLGNVARAAGDDRRAVFWWLRRFLAAHEAAESVFIRSSALVEGEDQEVAVQRRLDAGAVADLVARLEVTDVDSEDFNRQLEELRLAIGKQARVVELQELPRVLDETKSHDIDRMRQALDHVDVLVSHRNGPLGDRPRPFAQLLESATFEFETMQGERGV